MKTRLVAKPLTRIGSAALVAALVGSTAAFAGPGPGVPGFGERVEEAYKARQELREERGFPPYALTGDSNQIKKASKGPRLVQHYGRGGHNPWTGNDLDPES